MYSRNKCRWMIDQIYFLDNINLKERQLCCILYSIWNFDMHLNNNSMFVNGSKTCQPINFIHKFFFPILAVVFRRFWFLSPRNL
jgi:hypothetical protein